MTAFTLDSDSQLQAWLTHLQASLHLDDDCVRFSRFSGELLIEGCVPNYQTKCKIEKAALAAGLQIQNCLRVLPGAVVVATQSYIPTGLPSVR